MESFRLYSRLVCLIGVLLYGVLLAVLACVIERFVRDPLSVRQTLCRSFMACLVWVLPFRVRVEGKRPREPMLWVANHVSWTDIPLIGHLAPVSFLSKSEVRAWPLAGWLARHGGTLFIRRGAGESQSLSQQMGEYLENRHPLVMFPEGTTGDGLSVLPFHGRLLTAAVERNLPIQPVSLAYRRNGAPCPSSPFIGDETLPVHLFRLLRSTPCDVIITLLPVIPTEDRGRSEVARAARTAIVDALDLPAAPAEHVAA
ncbi:lysophospholipid acyltransferase family protein [Pseudomonas matsuisoli]|uniref:1-acyl-sn-glycerol-3-phosphate acyltransferase n=1 Tax=Pseudomonas matsuisoli TaxID=1515666 RepID=A0A917PVC9_9PSED|nr:lysophospholipid acyltransferase family protein [Pseudomonas matsuisoli]GGJ92844.1 1-acyl-sn-glycerol-3-phosphate acyltransferase [Pseudomonas matsuisoli]